jgi:hypothetical protein
MDRMTPFQLSWKLSWVIERPASSDYKLGKRKKSMGARSVEQGRWRIVWTSFATR